MTRTANLAHIKRIQTIMYFSNYYLMSMNRFGRGIKKSELYNHLIRVLRSTFKNYKTRKYDVTIIYKFIKDFSRG
jgi:hypothetical protein